MVKNDLLFKENEVKVILEGIVKRAQLKEGKESVRAILREIYRSGTIGTKILARKLHLPIPTIAAVRKELENIAFIARDKKGAILTPKGIKFVIEDLEIFYTKDLICKNCEGTTIELPFEAPELLAKLEQFMSQRPTPNTSIDQAFGMPITALRRALILLQNDDLEGRKILLLGDDDFTSLAIQLLKLKSQVTVLEIDNRLLEIIKDISTKENFSINCIKHDLRKPLPEDLMNKFDVILMDPQYTINGLKLFLSRALQALKKELNKKIYLSYAHRAPNEQFEIQKMIQAHNLAIQQIIPGFNLYEGAEMHGNTTYLAILSTIQNFKILVSEEFSAEIYTGEVKPTIRIYECKNKHQVSIGSNEKIHTIEELKEKGCPVCGSKEQFLRVKTIKL